jgi:hypothetical protein
MTETSLCPVAILVVTVILLLFLHTASLVAFLVVFQFNPDLQT